LGRLEESDENEKEKATTPIKEDDSYRKRTTVSHEKREKCTFRIVAVIYCSKSSKLQ